MAEPTNPKIELPPTEHWDMARLKQAVVQAFEQNRQGLATYEDLPRAVTLAGPTLDRLNTLAERSRANNCEFGFMLMFHPDRKVILVPRTEEIQNVELEMGNVRGEGLNLKESWRPTERFKHTADAETQQMLLQLLSIQLTQAKVKGDARFMMQTPQGRFIRERTTHAVASAHSHHINFPFSAIDVATLLGRHHHQFMLMIDTANVTNLLLTSYETERFDTDAETAAASQRWVKALHDRWQRLTDDDLADVTDLEANYRMQEALLKSIARKRKFGYYKGTNGRVQRVV